jgi:hypothetical protein
VLGNKRQNGVCGLGVTHSVCGHQTEVNVDAWPDCVPMPSFVRCRLCDHLLTSRHSRSTTRARLRLGKLIPFAFVRFLVVFFIGVAATLAWQSYGATAREVMASWSPHLSFLAPPPAPASTSTEQLVAMSRGLAVMRQDVDRLAANITKLQAIQQGAVDKTAATPPSPATVRKPVLQPPPPVRAPPAR